VSEFEQDSPELRYDFTHEKLRGLVYEKINPARRRLLHRRVAEALASHTTGPAKEQVYGKIGHHYRLAGNEASAAGFYKLAGDYARALFANREALNYYQTALTLGFTDTALLREASGDLYTLLGEYSAALRQYQLAYHPGSDNARLEYKTGNIYLRRGDWELANSQFESASGVMEPETGLAAQVLTEWALALHHLDRDEAAQGLAAKALALALENRDRPAQARAHNMLGLLAGHRRDPEVARDHLEQSLALSKALDDRALQAAALNNLSLVSLSSGELPKALELTRAALEIVTTLGDRHRQAALLSNLGDLYQALGQPEEARESVKQSVLIYAEIGFEAGAFQPGVWMLTDW
jgi:tetratricopeptide (TPR) repeat protein